MNSLNIEDVFPPEVVPDNSLSLFIFLTLFCLSVIYIFYFLYWKKRKKKKKDDAYHLDILLSSKFYNVKQSAYLFTYYGRRLVKTKEQKKELEGIISKLHVYKYQQKSLNIPQELQKDIKIFLEELRDFYA